MATNKPWHHSFQYSKLTRKDFKYFTHITSSCFYFSRDSVMCVLYYKKVKVLLMEPFLHPLIFRAYCFLKVGEWMVCWYPKSPKSPSVGAESPKIIDIFVGNKVRRQITKEYCKKTNYDKFSKKQTFLTPYSHTQVCVSGDTKCSSFRKIWLTLFSCNTRFVICRFALLPTIWCI